MLKGVQDFENLRGNAQHTKHREKDLLVQYKQGLQEHLGARMLRKGHIYKALGVVTPVCSKPSEKALVFTQVGAGHGSGLGPQMAKPLMQWVSPTGNVCTTKFSI
jgi:hypothetical protein